MKSKLGLRFLDDIHLFDSDRKKLLSDLVTLQELLGEKGLSINEGKTALGRVIDVDLPREVDKIKQGLLQMRRKTLSISGEDDDDDDDEPPHLDDRQVEYLLGVLQSPDIEESDAELVLVLLRDHADEVFGRMGDFLERYPGLAKSVYHFARLVADRSGLASVVLDFLSDSPNATEYQLFWLAKTAEDFLFDSNVAGKIVAALREHPRATIISNAKVLEIPSKRHGLPELREEVLRSGRSDWEAWAAAGGTRNELASTRNHLLTYFAKGSHLNSFLSTCFRSMP